MHIIFDESNPLDLRKDLIIFDDFVDDFMDMNLEDNDASKPLELEEPIKKEVQKASPPKIKLPKDWHYKKDYPKELILVETSKGVTTISSFKPLVNLSFIS